MSLPFHTTQVSAFSPIPTFLEPDPINSTWKNHFQIKDALTLKEDLKNLANTLEYEAPTKLIKDTFDPFIRSKDINGETLLEYAAKEDPYLLYYLLRKDSLTPYITKYEKEKVTNIALEKNIFNSRLLLTIATSKSTASQALIDALLEKKLDMITPILKFGANPNIEIAFTVDPADTCSPLHMVSEMGLPKEEAEQLIEKLIAFGADINKRNSSGETALHLDIKNKFELTPCLIRHEASAAITTNKGEAPLHYAARYLQSTDQFNSFLEESSKQNVSIDVPAQDDSRPLHYAVNFNENIVNTLLINGANPNMRDKKGLTPFHYALSQKTNLIETFLEHGADVDTPSKVGLYPLHFVALNIDPKALDIFLRKNPTLNLNPTNKLNQTPLFNAISVNNAPVVQALLNKNADVTICDHKGDSLWHAVAQTHPQLLKLLPKRVDLINQSNNYGTTPLSTLTNYHPDFIPEFVEAGADLNFIDDNNNTAMHIAAMCNTAAIDILLKQNLDLKLELEKENLDKCSPLSCLLLNQNQIDTIPKYIQLLCKNGANPNKKGRAGLTPLHIAAQYCPIGIKPLLDQNANIEATTEDGATPLTQAILYNSEEAVKELIDAGANTKLVFHNRLSLLHLAVLYCPGAIKPLLDKKLIYTEVKDAAGITPLACAIFSNSKKAAISLIEGGANIDLAFEGGLSLLHVAAIYCPGAINPLLNLKADIEAVAQDGSTPLIKAILCNSIEAVKVLIERGANLNFNLQKGHSLLHLAAIYCPEAIPFLLDKRVIDIDTRDEDGMTPLAKAIFSDSIDAIVALIEGGANLNLTFKNKLSYLHLATQFCPRAIPFLLDKNVIDINAKSVDDCTALAFAVFYDSKEAVTTLIERGADANLTFADGASILHLAAAHGHIDIFKLLLEKGLNPNLQAGEQAWTPLFYAAKFHPETVSEIITHSEKFGLNPNKTDKNGYPYRVYLPKKLEAI